VARIGVAPAALVAWLGPAIGAAFYEVGREVYDAFVPGTPGAAAAFASSGEDKHRADLHRLARLRLAACGVTEVHGGGHCTYVDAARFYSYRRDRNTGRFASLIWIA
jgi:hypothetical protein